MRSDLRNILSLPSQDSGTGTVRVQFDAQVGRVEFFPIFSIFICVAAILLPACRGRGILYYLWSVSTRASVEHRYTLYVGHTVTAPTDAHRLHRTSRGCGCPYTERRSPFFNTREHNWTRRRIEGLESATGAISLLLLGVFWAVAIA